MHPPEALCSLVVYATYFMPAGFLLFSDLIHAKPLCGHTCSLLVLTGCTQDNGTFPPVRKSVFAFHKKFYCGFLSEGPIGM